MDSNRNLGRPVKAFKDISERSKRRRVREVREGLDAELIQRAAVPTRFSAEKALALILDNSLSKSQYENIRLEAKKNRADIYPPYNEIRECKATCYPENICISEDEAMVPLESLLIHTVRRLIESMPLAELESFPKELKFTVKWGCDGSSGHSQYKQKFMNAELTDAHIFLTSMVPLELTTPNGEIVWRNATPSSPRYCRPIRFKFVKERDSAIREEVNRVEEEISHLQRREVEAHEKTFLVDYEAALTMIDGKVLQAINDTMMYDVRMYDAV